MRVTMRVRGGRRQLASLREIGLAVSLLQKAGSLQMHAERDACDACNVKSWAMMLAAIRYIPLRLRRDRAWVHRHVTMPAMRIHARVLDGLVDDCDR